MRVLGKKSLILFPSVSGQCKETQILKYRIEKTNLGKAISTQNNYRNLSLSCIANNRYNEEKARILIAPQSLRV